MAIFDRLLPKRQETFEIDDPYKYEREDCLSCKVLGSTALVSLGGYTYFSGMKQLREKRSIIEAGSTKYKYGSRALGIVGMSATFVALGIYRMIN